MDTQSDTQRPNLIIQVNNSPKTSEEAMEVDVAENDNEEGEIMEDGMHEDHSEVVSSKIHMRNPIFTTGINIFGEKEQEKLQQRAKRFALKPEEIHSFSDQDLEDLYESLGINSTNKDEIKFEFVHLLGLGDMSADDIVEYFVGYAPEGIEWIDDNSCNVVWLDSISAARALHFKSRCVRGMPARAPKDTFPKEFLDSVEEPDGNSGQSILVKNQNREIVMQNEVGEIIAPKKRVFPENSVDITKITVPIPPGYWRLGNPHPKTKCLLIRFASITDKMPFQSEKCSKYYKKLNAGRGIVSETTKKDIRGIFERNKELNQGNPWASLARNWDHDEEFREREPVISEEKDASDPVQVIVKNPKLQARLGAKRKLESDEEKSMNEKEEDVSKRVKVQKKQPKLPRMKMYADEEEENQKRKKILMKIKKQSEEIDGRGDLRNMLGSKNRVVAQKIIVPEAVENVDLCTKLKNRNHRMIFAVERDASYREEEEKEAYPRLMYSDARRELLHMREKSPSRSILLKYRKETSSDRKMVEEGGRKSQRSSRRRTPERTLHSDRIQSSRRRRSRSYSPQNNKPRSKVAVVVRSAPKKPTVASTIWSKVTKSSDKSSSGSESDSSSARSSSGDSSSSSDSESDEDGSSSSTRSKKRIRARNPDRPGFDKSRLNHGVNSKSPLKITTANEHFSRRLGRK